MWSFVLALAIASATAPIKVASAGIEGTGVDAKLLVLLEEHVAQRLAMSGKATVVTAGDVTAVLGAERRRQLLGCAADSTGCMVELAGALGVRYLLVGDLARLGARFSVTLKLLDTSRGFAVFAQEARAANEDDLPLQFERLTDALAAALDTLRPAPPLTPVAIAPAFVNPTVPSARKVNWLPVLPAVAGAALAATGAVFLARAGDQLRALSGLADAPTGADPLAQGATLRDGGRRDALNGTFLLGAGGVALLVALTWWLLVPSQPPQVTLVQTPRGFILAKDLP